MTREAFESAAPYKQGRYIVSGLYRTGKLYVVAPPGWFRRNDGTYQKCQSAGPEHGKNRDHAYPFSLSNALRVADNCCGTVEEL